MFSLTSSDLHLMFPFPDWIYEVFGPVVWLVECVVVMVSAGIIVGLALMLCPIVMVGVGVSVVNAVGMYWLGMKGIERFSRIMDRAVEAAGGGV
jgi:ABC-type transport system involved in cytochrome bd biosynthesis fused ATPase/permease subunit